MDALHALPLRKGWIYEVVVCTFSGHTPHAAPFGTWTDDHAHLELAMYAGSRTLENVLASRELVVAFPRDVRTLFTVLFEPERLEFDEAATVRAPVLRGAAATVELVVRETAATDEGTRVTALPRQTRAAGDAPLLNRADGLLLESLVLATRLGHRDAGAVLAALAENLRVVGKVAPGSDAERALGTLVERLGPPRGAAGA